jgi:hypothetical protein
VGRNSSPDRMLYCGIVRLAKYSFTIMEDVLYPSIGLCLSGVDITNMDAVRQFSLHPNEVGSGMNRTSFSESLVQSPFQHVV